MGQNRHNTIAAPSYQCRRCCYAAVCGEDMRANSVFQMSLKQICPSQNLIHEIIEILKRMAGLLTCSPSGLPSRPRCGQ